MTTKFTFAHNIWCTTDYEEALKVAREVRHYHRTAEHYKIRIIETSYIDASYGGAYYTKDYTVAIFRHHNQRDLPF